MKNLKNFDGFVNESSDSDHYGSNKGLSREFPPKITKLPKDVKIGGDLSKDPIKKLPGGSFTYPTGIYLEYGYEHGPDYSFVEAIFISARDEREAKSLFLEAVEADHLSDHSFSAPFNASYVEGVLRDDYFSGEGWTKPHFEMIEVPMNSRTPMGTFVKETVYNAGSSVRENGLYQNLTEQTFKNFFGSDNWPGPLISFAQ